MTRTSHPLHVRSTILLAVVLTASPVLLAAPQEWTIDKEEAARELFNEGRWPESVQAWAELVKEAPQQAAFWNNYAFSLHVTMQYPAAAQAWERALALGFRPAETMYNLACATSRGGEHETALAWLTRSLQAGFDDDETLWNDTDLDPLRDLDEFKRITGIGLPAEASRAARWARDLDHLRRRMEMLHHDLYAEVDPAVFAGELERLATRIDALEDEEIAVEIQRIVAMVGDGHTFVDLSGSPLQPGIDPEDRRPPPLRLPDVAFPVDLYRFSDGLFVRDASEQSADLIGLRVMRVGDIEIEEALARVAPYCSRDNAMGLAFVAPLQMVRPAVAKAAGLLDADGRMRLTLADTAGAVREVALDPAPMPDGMERFARLAGRGHPDAEAPLPLHLTKPVVPFWWVHDEEHDLVYFQINLILDLYGMSLESTCREVFDLIAAEKPNALVIDLRHNSGGNNLLLQPLIHSLIRCDEINRRGHLFVIIGRRTFSAAMNCVNALERETEAIFVGEPTGSKPNFVGEVSLLTLPGSGLRVSASSLYWQDAGPRDHRTWVAPRISAPLSSEDWRRNRDPALDSIVDFLGR